MRIPLSIMFFILIVETAYTQDKIIAKDLTKKELRSLKRKKLLKNKNSNMKNAD